MAEVAGSNPAEPIFFFESEAKIVADDEHDEDEKLHNQLCNINKKAPAQNRDDDVGPSSFLEMSLRDYEQGTGRRRPRMFRWEAESDTISKPDAATRADGLEHSSEESEDLVGASAGVQITQTYVEYLGDNYEKRQAEPLSSRLERGGFPQRAAHATRRRKHSELSFSKSELDSYVVWKKERLAPKSKDWINRASQVLWDCTHGDVSEETMTGLRTFILDKYSSEYSHRKAVGFAVAFLKRLSKTRAEPLFNSLTVYLELPKNVKVRKTITGRVVTREDIVETLKRIDAAESEEKLKPQKARNYRAFALLASYTGLRPSTIQRLMVGQIRTALKEDKPALHVLAEQEKNRVEHWAPLHSVAVMALNNVLENDFGDKEDAKHFFMYNSFENWLERHRIPLPRVSDPNKAHLWLSDFRKFAEQFGDIISWDTTNRKYVLAHGMTGVEWEHYKNPQREHVYDKYMEAWKGIDLRAVGEKQTAAAKKPAEIAKEIDESYKE